MNVKKMKKIRPFYDGKTGLWGFRDAAGTEIVPAKYSMAWPMHENRAAAKTTDGAIILVDSRGIER